MTRVAVPLQSLTPNGGYDVDLAFTAADAGNDHYVDNSSGKVLIAIKNDSGSPITVTFSGVNCTDVTVAAAAGALAMAGPFPPALFNQIAAGELGRLYFGITDATSLSFAAIKLP
jgi:hypothetical protein